MDTKETLSRFYLLEPQFFKFLSWEEDPTNLHKIKVEKELESVLAQVFQLLRPAFQKWIEFHVGNTSYITYLLYRAGTWYDYVRGEDPLVDRMVDEGGAACCYCANTHWNLKMVFEKDRLQRAAYGALVDFYWRIHPQIWEDRSYCREVAAIESQVWDNQFQASIQEAYWEFLDSQDTWNKMSIGERTTATSILLTMAHHTGPMLTWLFPSEEEGREFLTSLSNLGG